PLSGPTPLNIGNNTVASSGIGTLTLSGNNTGFLAGVNLNNGNLNSINGMGTLILPNAAALGTGPLTLSSGNLQTTSAGGLTIPNQLASGATAGSIVTFTGSNPFTFSNPLSFYDALAATLIYQASTNASVTINETIAGPGGLTVMGGNSNITFIAPS